MLYAYPFLFTLKTIFVVFVGLIATSGLFRFIATKVAISLKIYLLMRTSFFIGFCQGKCTKNTLSE